MSSFHILEELGLLALAFVLSLTVGIERSRKQKSAGLRTHVLVGIGAAMFTLISAYGFEGIARPGVAVDPSRIAAQVVSGIGFLGAGVIFVRKNAVSGLTSAATIWMVAAIGMACGANMPILAIAGTGLHLLTVGPLTQFRDRFQPEPERLRVSLVYIGNKGTLREIIAAAERRGMPTTLLGAQRILGTDEMRATLQFTDSHHTSSQLDLVHTIATLDGVVSVNVQGHTDED